MVRWLAGVDVVEGNDSGTWAADNEDAPKIVLHSTEGPTISSALGAYRKNNSWPHLTVDPSRRRRVQHVPLDRPARALRNTSRPGQTNREGRVFQVEIVGRARTMRDLPGDQLDWLGAEVVGPLARATGTPLVSSVEFLDERAGFTLASEDARQRLTAAAWDTYSGVLGHQHVPENTHWDPGAIDINRILTAARGSTAPTPTTGKETPMTDDDRKLLAQAVAEAQAAGLRAAHCEQLLAEVLEALNVRTNTPDGKRPYPVRAIEALTRIEAHLGSNG